MKDALKTKARTRGADAAHCERQRNLMALRHRAAVAIVDRGEDVFMGGVLCTPSA
jgi:hypothetical protein